MKAIGYIRCSTQEQADSGLGLDAQAERIRAYCGMKGLPLLDLITDPGVSGGKPLASREGGQRLLTTIRERKADAVILLKFEPGRRALKSVAQLVQGVLNHSFAGSEFLFGALGEMDGGASGLGAMFAFQVLPTIIFVAALFGALYHMGVMQLIVGLLARLMVKTMGTSGAESLSVAASETDPVAVASAIDRTRYAANTVS